MPALLDKDKAKPNKPEVFVEKQIQDARGRIRALDFFQAGLVMVTASLFFVAVLLLIDRAYETPAGAGWAAIAGWVLACGGYAWYALFRPSRRHINPFYAAHQVEQTIPGAKNSVVNYVDLQDDESVPASVKASIGARAARDMKQVDLSEAIQKKHIIYLAIVAVIAFLGMLVAAFLPATRTTMVLVAPKDGNTTVVQGEDVLFKVELKGRIPEKGQPDAARVRIWYNPEDPGNYEERPLEPVEGERGMFGHTMPARQVRNGFFYQIFAGNTKTAAYEVKLRIIPQFTGTWEVDYVYPAYLGREPEKKNDQNLVGYFNTQVTLTGHANRPVQSAVLEIDGQPQSYPNIRVENDAEALRFQFPMTRNGRYRIRFVTTEGHPNPDPQWFRISLVDPKPVLRFFDVTYKYPKYLRYEDVTAVQREPHLEVNRGTQVTLVAHANRPIKQALIQMEGVEGLIQGTIDKLKPMQATFKLPMLMKDGAYRVWFSPDTGEADSDARVFSIRIISDESPKVEIVKPQQEESEVPANGTLGVEGVATDDHGLAKMNLRFQVTKPAPGMALAHKPYRGGISFKRENDNSYPNQIDYKDVIELAKLKADGEAAAGFSVQAGMEIEYWLEAIDNCDVPPGPNSAISRKMRIRVLAPETNEEKKKKLEQEKQNLDREKQQHEQKQDQKNANEKRDPQQPQPKNDQPQQGDPQQGEPKEGEPKEGEPKGDPKGGKQSGKGGKPMPGDPMGDPNMGEPMENAELKKQEDEVKNALGKKEPMNPKNQPTEKNPGADEPKMPEPKKEEPKDPEAKTDVKKDEKPDPRQLPKPEDVEKLAEKLDSLDKKEREEAREQIKKNIDQAKNDPRKPEEAQKQIDDHRKKLNEPDRKQFDESMERVAREMNDIQREKRVQDAVDKITSGDKQKQQEGQQQLQNELNDPKTGEDTERQLQNLAGDMGTERQQQIGDAMNLAKENNAKKQPPKKDVAKKQPPPPMEMEKEEEDVDKLAKKKQKGTEEEKREAEQKLEDLMRDPKTRDQVQKQLDDFKKNIKDEQERKDFEKQMERIAENAKKDPNERKADEIQKLADQLKSDKKEERDAAQKGLEEAMKQADKDPKAREQAQKQLKDARDSIKDPMKQQQFDQAVKDINDAVEKNRQEQAAAEQKRKDDLDQIAKDLNSKDPAKQQAAEKKLEEMLKDPKSREQVKDAIDKAKKDAPTAESKDKLGDAAEKAMDNVARKEALDRIEKDLNSKDPDKQAGAKQRLEEKLADPKTRDQVKQDLEKLKEGLKDQQAKDNVDKAVGDAEKNIARNKQEAEKIANDLNSKDPAKQQAAQKKLEEMLKDPATREQVQKELDKLKQEGDAKSRETIDKATEQAREEAARQKEMERLARDLGSLDKDKREAAQRKLEEKLADPKTRDQVKQELEKLKEGLKNQQAKDAVDDAVDQAEKNIAQKKDEAGKLAQDLTGKDNDKREAAEKKLEDLLRDPKTRDQVKKELEDIKKNLGDDQAKAKLDDAIKNAEQKSLARKDGKGGEPKKEDLENIAKELSGSDKDKKAAAEQKLRDALKDPATRAQVEKAFNDIKDKLADPKEKQQLADALNKAKDEIAKAEKPLDPREIEKLVKDAMGKDPKLAEEANKKLGEMLNDPAQRQQLAKAIEDLMKNLKDGKGDPAQKQFEDKLKDLKDHMAKKFDPDGAGKTGHVDVHKGTKPGANTTQQAKDGENADLKNKVKSSELLLEKFKRNITDEEFRKQLGWTEKQIADFQKKYEEQLAALKKQLELEAKGELPMPRESGGSSRLDTAEHIKIDPRDGAAPLRGGRGVAPPGFGDAYERFTEGVSGIEKKTPPTK